MSDGSHPSAIGIVQTHDEETGGSIFGATYHPALFRDGMRTELKASYCLAQNAERLQLRSDLWHQGLLYVEHRLESHLPTLVAGQT